MNEIGFDSLDIYNSKSELWFAGKAHCDLTTGDLLFTFVNESAEQAIEFKIEAIELNGNIYNSVSKEVSCNLKLSPQKQLNLSDFAKTKFYYKGQDLMPKKDDIHVIEIKHENKPGLNNNIGTNLPQGIKMPMHHAGGITHYHYTLHILNPEEQIPFLTKQIKLLSEEQAEFLVNKSRAKGATLVFGGSCINTFGQQKETTNTLTDLNLGFINISPRLIARIIDEFNTLFAKEPVNHPIIKHKWIYPGSQPNSLAKILSPEEFFLRSGKTINGEIFKATGFIKVNPGGTIEIGHSMSGTTVSVKSNTSKNNEFNIYSPS